MKPAFALSLSSDGIELIYRAKDGWRSVGGTPFDADDLPAALAAMREDAQRLAPGEIFCKLVLPDNQIRYLTAETGDLPAEARIEAARQALEGTTPYPVDELAFDISIEGSRTHVAAVALETLDEAETFAVEHGFGPVSFVAAPEASGFRGEPFFGTTRAIRGTEVEPDDTAVKIIGPAALAPPRTEDSADTGAAPALTGDSTVPATVAAVTEPLAEPAGPEALAEAEEMAAAAKQMPETNDAPQAARKDGPAESPAKPAGGAEDPAQDVPGSAGQQAKAGPAARATAPADPVPVSAAPSPVPPAPLAAAHQPPAAPAAVKPAAAAIAVKKPDTAVLSASRPPVPPTPLAVSAPPAGTVPPQPIPPAPAVMRDTAPAAAAPAASQSPAPQKAAEGKPRYLGVILTAVLLLFMATVAVWAVFGEGGFFAAAPEQDSGPAPAPAVSSEDRQPEAGAPRPAAPAAADGPATETAPAAIAPQVSVLADQPDPGLQETGAAPAEGETLGQTALADGSEADGLPSAEDEAAADGAELPEEGTDTAFLDPRALQPGGAAESAAASAEPEAEEPLDELAQAARYAATGVWPVAPGLGDIPAAPRLDELYTASVDRTDIAADAVALPQPDAFAGDDEPGSVASPAVAGSAFDLDARGLVKATPGGTLNPDGITVYLGRPAKVPPRAPDRSDPAAEALAEEVARNQVLSRKRPKARPADLEEQVERAQHGGLSRAELASLRPRQRPASLKPAEEEQLPVTAQAIAASAVPRKRPSNFANLVDRARRNAQNQVQTAAAVPAAAAAAAPRIPTAASVARRATVGNAINLRKLNLIGVYGTASDRRALVRLPSGRYKKVQVGDRIDGGRVIAIGESRLQYQKGGRNRTLEMPKG
ncbi:hypothetical protein [Leisingera methylohalidivorans]|uniref:Translation initiation factor 2 n=1 Tax=Leisingera methylohalidivorans DSM 14336 TaxID=999552 RepID=V9VX39_9RHOB|nr:hypothetical protein [Leisingera methylohalidivorans]AHD01452.1 hypothetical protein METH_12875 [Leisingera methylohalidivorans DSM 14336]